MQCRASVCGEGRAEACWPSLYFSGGSEAPCIVFKFFFFLPFLVAPCDKVSPLLQPLLFFRT